MGKNKKKKNKSEDLNDFVNFFVEHMAKQSQSIENEPGDFLGFDVEADDTYKADNVIRVGDYVGIDQVDDTFRHEKVIAISVDPDGHKIYIVSGGTWHYAEELNKFKIQGKLREEILDLIHSVC
jgi:hypothetical protein